MRVGEMPRADVAAAAALAGALLQPRLRGGPAGPAGRCPRAKRTTSGLSLGSAGTCGRVSGQGAAPTLSFALSFPVDVGPLLCLRPDATLPPCNHPVFAPPSHPAPPPPSPLPREQRSRLLTLTPSSSFQPPSRLPGAVQGPGCRRRERPSVERPLGSGVSPVFLVNILHVFSKFLFCFLFGHFPTPKGRTENFEKPHSIFRKKGTYRPRLGTSTWRGRGPWHCCMRGWGAAGPRLSRPALRRVPRRRTVARGGRA